MASIYSQKLYNQQLTTPGTSVVYTVPASTTVVVTDVCVFLSNTAINQVSKVKLGNTNIHYHTSAAAELFLDHWVGKQVLTDGDTIVFEFSGSLAGLAVTGYVLPPL